MIYLAIPYCYNPAESFSLANKVSAILMAQGHVVFSPISHSHPIADHLPDKLRFSHDFWMKQDLPILAKCDALYVVVNGENGMSLIENSRGCQEELKFAEENGITIKYFHV